MNLHKKCEWCENYFEVASERSRKKFCGSVCKNLSWKHKTTNKQKKTLKNDIPY